MALLVFTHGLGASAGFWGSTIDTLRSHDGLSGHTFKDWSYRTSKRPFLTKALGRSRYQDLSEIGEQMWSNLRNWSEGHEAVVLVGHSMGGLVTAAASVYGFTSGDDQDIGLCNKLRGLLCIASPFAGANQARNLEALYKRLGVKNKQIADLLPDSENRRTLIQDFTRTVLAHSDIDFFLMRAADDAVISPGDITSPFSQDQYQMDVLSGDHSECVSNLRLADDNVAKLVVAIRQILNPDSLGKELVLFKSRAVTIRSEYHKRLSQMEEGLDIMAWGLVSFREDYGHELREWANAGTRVRILLVNPHSPEGDVLCRLQDRIECRPSGSTAADVQMFLDSVCPITNKLEIRVSKYHPGVNLFRIDTDIFFGPYLAGTVSRNSPTGIVSEGHWLYDRLSSHFNWLWRKASIWPMSENSA
ncbi:MAG: alpha/beta hydrolase [bacterium]|nr:alpha/beta hydrolase [bacterium]